MAEAYTSTQVDTRNLGTMLNRLLDDLNRPDLQSEALQYIQDAIRYYQRRPFFFNETDNSATALYANSTNYPQGSVIQANLSGTAYAICALNAGTSGSSGTPAFPTSIFTPPTTAGSFPPPPVGTPGTIVDNNITWANVGLWSSTVWTQLATVYSINQYVPPIDYATPERIEVTAANLRFDLIKISYQELRNYDVIRPAPITVYPSYWAWFQQQIYLWPYPNGSYPLTLSYRAAPPMLTLTSQSNFWTTQAERLIRKYAQASIEREVIHDDEAAAISMTAAKEELAAIRSQAIMQNNPVNAGISPSDW